MSANNVKPLDPFLASVLEKARVATVRELPGIVREHQLERMFTDALDARDRADARATGYLRLMIALAGELSDIAASDDDPAAVALATVLLGRIERGMPR